MTTNKEDYLKIIYKLMLDYEAEVNNKKIAEILNVSAASVSEMLRKLEADKYIYYTPYKEIRLTQEGLEIAQKLVRKHRLWEVFLTKMLGCSWSDVHDQAEKLEHMTSDVLYERLDKFLGHPDFCPHGYIINAVETHSHYVKLNTLSVGDSAIVKRVHEDKELLDYLTYLGIGLNSIVTVMKIAPFKGALTLEINGRTEQISNMAASYILVEKQRRKNEKNI